MTALCIILALIAAGGVGLALWTNRYLPALVKENLLLRNGLLYLRPLNCDVVQAYAMHAAFRIAEHFPFRLTEEQVSAVHVAAQKAIEQCIFAYQSEEIEAIAREKAAAGTPSCPTT